MGVNACFNPGKDRATTAYGLGSRVTGLAVSALTVLWPAAESSTLKTGYSSLRSGPRLPLSFGTLGARASKGRYSTYLLFGEIKVERNEESLGQEMSERVAQRGHAHLESRRLGVGWGEVQHKFKVSRATQRESV